MGCSGGMRRWDCARLTPTCAALSPWNTPQSLLLELPFSSRWEQLPAVRWATVS